jgi:APA family basic amino acid/polyamine antiporter
VSVVAAVRSADVVAAATPTLTRRLGPIDASAIVLSNVIGGGIFFVPVLVAELTPSPWHVLSVWLAGGLLAFAGAMAYAELATLRPRAGGEYVYLREAFGARVAFLSGWTSFVAGFSGAIAAGAMALAESLGRFVPFAGNRIPLVSTPYIPVVVSPQAIVAIAAIAGFSLLHLHGSGRVVNNVLAGLKVLAFVVFIALGLSIGAGSVSHFVPADSASVPATNWLLALIPVMFTYSGWNAATYVAEEIRDPDRNLPRALAVGTLAVVALYLALNALYLYAMPVDELARLPHGRLADLVAERLFGFVAGGLLALFTVVSIAASVSAMVLAGPRVYYAMARDGAFLRPLARIHPTFRTPALAIVAQGVWSAVLVLSGTLSDLVAFTGFAVVLFSGIAVLALFVLRRREPKRPRPFRALGYPFAPAVFVLASLLMVVNEVWNSPATSLTGLGIMAAGLPVYALFARNRPAGS